MAVPVVTFVGPATLTADDPIVVEVTSTPALASGVIAFTFPGIPTTELPSAGAGANRSRITGCTRSSSSSHQEAGLRRRSRCASSHIA